MTSKVLEIANLLLLTRHTSEKDSNLKILKERKRLKEKEYGLNRDFLNVRKEILV